MRIGIITHYYKSLNYGGVLQAYALQKVLELNGFDAEQLQIQYEAVSLHKSRKSIFKKIKKIPEFLWRKTQAKRLKQLKERKESCFKPFREDYIRHSEEIYNKSNVNSANNVYDCFITGSDQVWNFNWYNPIYFLDFVNADKIRMSYAASFSMSEFTQYEKYIIKNSLGAYAAISVREEGALKPLEEIGFNNVSCVLDPTLILDTQIWNNLSEERLIKDEYIFVYFLSGYSASRKLVKKYAKQFNIKIVAVSIPSNVLFISDRNFADIELTDVSPQNFISLIRFADAVFTDSFHAVVFSLIFKRNFYVFRRAGYESMGSRITSVLRIAGLDDRFCNTKKKETIEYLEEIGILNDSDFNKFDIELNKQRKLSIDFLLNNIKTGNKR